MSNLTLIIPAKNESESLPMVLNELKDLNYNINIVLHKSDHKTIESLRKTDVKIIYQQNLGYGDALIYGINKCETKYFCIFFSTRSMYLRIQSLLKSYNIKWEKITH